MQLFGIWSQMARQWLDVMDVIISQPIIMPISWGYEPTYPDVVNWND